MATKVRTKIEIIPGIFQSTYESDHSYSWDIQDKAGDILISDEDFAEEAILYIEERGRGLNKILIGGKSTASESKANKELRQGILFSNGEIVNTYRQGDNYSWEKKNKNGTIIDGETNISEDAIISFEKVLTRARERGKDK